MKECSKCKHFKERTEFYKDKRTDDGLYSACKTCHNIDNEHSKRNREVSKSPAYKARKSKYITAYKKRPEEALKERARYLLRQALKKGVITMDWCAEEDETCKGRIEGHHEDYSKPYDVLWVCKKHHLAIHHSKPL